MIEHGFKEITQRQFLLRTTKDWKLDNYDHQHLEGTWLIEKDKYFIDSFFRPLHIESMFKKKKKRSFISSEIKLQQELLLLYSLDWSIFTVFGVTSTQVIPNHIKGCKDIYNTSFAQQNLSCVEIHTELLIWLTQQVNRPIYAVYYKPFDSPKIISINYLNFTSESVVCILLLPDRVDHIRIFHITFMNNGYNSEFYFVKDLVTFTECTGKKTTYMRKLETILTLSKTKIK